MQIRLPKETMDWVMRNKNQLTMEQFVVSHLNRLARQDSKKEDTNETAKHIHTIHPRI